MTTLRRTTCSLDSRSPELDWRRNLAVKSSSMPTRLSRFDILYSIIHPIFAAAMLNRN